MHSLLFEGNSRKLSYVDLVNGFTRRNSMAARTARSAKRMRDGDLWDAGKGYIGPMPAEDDENAKQTYAELRARFTGRNCVEEVTERMVDCLLGRSPNWQIYNKKNILSKTEQRAKDREVLEEKLRMTFTSIAKLASGEVDNSFFDQNDTLEDNNEEETENEGIDADIDSRLPLAELLISEAWTNYGLKDVMEQVFDERLVTGAGKTRIRFSKRLLDGEISLPDTNNEFELLSSVLKYITIEKADNDTTKVLNEDGDKVSITRLEDKNTRLKGIEISFVEDTSTDTYVMVIDQKGKTDKTKQQKPQLTKPQLQESIPTLTTSEEIDENEEVNEVIEKLKSYGDVSTGFWLDGNILVDEIVGRPYISESMLQNNRALNLDLSLAAGILVEAGYPEMVTTNVALKDGQTLKRGASVATNLVGISSTDQYGAKHFATPGIHYKDPSPLDAFDVGENLFYRQILNEARQAYILNSKDYNVSGESKIQSRQDFLKKAIKYKSSIDRHGGWLLTTILHLIASLAGKDGYFKDLAVMFDCKVFAGELSSDEKNTVILMQEKGLIDRETAMVLLGIEDPILTIEKVRLDKAEELEFLMKKTIIEGSIKNKNGGDDNEIKTSEEEAVRGKNNRNVNNINGKKITGEERIK